MVIVMLSRGGPASKRYRGSDRRGEDRVPPALPRERWTRWHAVAGWALLFTSMGAAAATAMWPPGNVSAITLHGGLSLGSYIVALLASLGLYVRWRMSGEANTGLLAAAF